MPFVTFVYNLSTNYVQYTRDVIGSNFGNIPTCESLSRVSSVTVFFSLPNIWFWFLNGKGYCESDPCFIQKSIMEKSSWVSWFPFHIPDKLNWPVVVMNVLYNLWFLDDKNSTLICRKLTNIFSSQFFQPWGTWDRDHNYCMQAKLLAWHVQCMILFRRFLLSGRLLLLLLLFIPRFTQCKKRLPTLNIPDWSMDILYLPSFHFVESG